MLKFLKEAADLRYSVKIPNDSATSAELLEALQDHRTRLDRIEHILTSCVIRKASATLAVRSANDNLNDKWDENISNQKKQKSVSLVTANQFEAPKEKYATANLATFEHRRVVRAAEEDLAWIETAVDALQKMYRGLDSSRQDILTRIKAIPVVNNLEYTTS
jgi:hypothetical protein